MGDFWMQVKLDQLSGGRDKKLFRLWKKRQSQVGVCDEMGISNVRIKTPSGKTERLVPLAHPSEPLYGGTICGRIGIITRCAQFVVPLKYAKDHYDQDADKWESSHMRLHIGESDKAGAPSPGHEFFFQTFLSVLFANEEGSQCPHADSDLSPGEECGDNQDHVCALPSWETKNGTQLGGVACGTVQIPGDDLSYAQRFVDPDTCDDLIRPSLLVKSGRQRRRVRMRNKALGLKKRNHKNSAARTGRGARN